MRVAVVNISVLCHTKITIFIKKCFNVTFILINNTNFDITIALKNGTFFFLVEAMDNKMRSCFCFHTTNTRYIKSVLNKCLSVWLERWLQVSQNKGRYFISLRLQYWKMITQTLECSLWEACILPNYESLDMSIPLNYDWWKEAIFNQIMLEVH